MSISPNDIVRRDNQFGLVVHAPDLSANDPEALVRFDQGEVYVPVSELEPISPYALDRLVELYILQQYRVFQRDEFSCFNVAITSDAYASSREGLKVEFKCGNYQNLVTTSSLSLSVGTWLARESANRALAPQNLLS